MQAELELDKNCVFCMHFAWDYIYTPPQNGAYGWTLAGGGMCKMGQFDSLRPFDEEEFKAKLESAMNCNYFERPPKEKK